MSDKEKGVLYDPPYFLHYPSIQVNRHLNNGGIPAGNIMQIQSDGEGTFKCHPKGTKVIMYDGTFKDVSKIRVGDKLMGPDSKPRKVLSVGTGKEQCYRIIPNKGESWECNASHKLSLVGSGKRYDGRIDTITVQDYLKKSKRYKKHFLLYRPDGIDFLEDDESIELPIHPYLLGLWLGDGTSRLDGTVHITNEDPEIQHWLENYSLDHDLTLRIHNYKDKATKLSIIDKKSSWTTPNRLTQKFKDLNLTNNKHIPHIYKTAGRRQRLQLLAGLIDSDGTFNASTKVNFSITQSNKRMAEDIAFVARSLGLTGNVYKYQNKKYNTPFWRISICGETANIGAFLQIERKKPNKRNQKRNHLRTGFTVQSTEVKKYYGFTLDKDQLYLLKDFTVTHNTSAAIQILADAQKQGLEVGYIDAEGALSENARPWLEGMGLVVEECYFQGPATGEEHWEKIEEWIVEDGVDVIVMDSIHAVQPSKLYTGDVGDHHIGNHAMLHKQGLIKTKSILQEHDATLIAINHKKVNLTAQGAFGKKATGGSAWGFYSEFIFVHSRTTSQGKLEGEHFIPIKIYIEKNKGGESFINIETHAEQGYGISESGEVLAEGLKVGLFQKKGSWYSVKESDEYVTTAQGESSMIEWIKQNLETLKERLKNEDY